MTSDLCDAGAVPHQSSYQANWELVVMWVRIPVQAIIIQIFLAAAKAVLKCDNQIHSLLLFSFTARDIGSYETNL